MILITLFALSGSVQAEIYQIKVSLGPEDFLGACNQDKINSGDLDAFGECVGNFFNPTIPNPLNALNPVTGDNLKAKIDAINIFDPLTNLNVSELLTKFINIPLVLIASVIELIAASITFLLVFAVKFIFVYLFYVSLGFQSILLMMDSNSQGLKGVTKIHASLLVMGVVTILALTYGGGWITWS